MGVRGILQYITQNQAYEIIDLVEIARKKEIEIIVDTLSLNRCIVEISIKKMARDFKNDFLLLPVGEYDIMGQVYYDFHMALKEVGIKLVWVVDGPKGVDEECSKQKITTWKERDLLSITKKTKILKTCDEMTKLKLLNDCCPIIDLEFGLEQLKNAGAEIIHLLSGEADDFIAYTYKQRNSFAILTNDSDYLFFEDCNVLFEKMFTLFYDDDSLKLPFVDNGNIEKVFKKPNSFRGAITNSRQLCSKLNFSNYDQLVVLGILKGNDFTFDHSQSLAFLTGITRNAFHHPFMEQVAKYIRSHNVNSRNIVEIAEIQNYLKLHRDLEDSIRYSQEFYSLRRMSKNLSLNPQRALVNNGCLTTFLAKKISNGEINRYCFAIHHGSYFESICTEPYSVSGVYIMNLLEDIRAKIYPLLLNKSRNKVSIWRSRIGQFFDVPVVHAQIQTDGIKSDPVGLQLFDSIWSHMESDSLNYFERFRNQNDNNDKTKALILYILRYLYRRNRNEYLNLTMLEFKALFLTVFHHYDTWKDGDLIPAISKNEFRIMKISPSGRCLTIATWFMNMYYTAKYICGSALNLIEYFPPPTAIINGSTFFAFFETINGGTTRINHLTANTRGDLRRVEAEILSKFESEYNAIIQI